MARDYRPVSLRRGVSFSPPGLRVAWVREGWAQLQTPALPGQVLRGREGLVLMQTPELGRVQGLITSGEDLQLDNAVRPRVSSDDWQASAPRMVLHHTPWPRGKEALDGPAS